MVVTTGFADEAYSQKTLLSVKTEKNSTLSDVFATIERQSQYVFFYSDHNIDLNRRVKVNVKDQPIEKILTELFAGTDNTFLIQDRQVFISKRAGTAAPAATQQATRKLKGKVLDETGAPLPGATIQVVGSTRGVITDLNGVFEIDVTAADKLKISFLGLEEQIITVGNRTEVVINMKPQANELEDVVIVGYGKQKKLSVTGAVSMADVGEVQKVATPSLSNAIAGQLPGIISRQAIGEPGYDQAQIYIRGVATWGTQTPLILVDGVERDLNYINSQEVESFTILKDASATAVYGARGANGVILITTKRGKVGKPDITFRSESAILTALRRPDYINGYEYASLMNEALRYNGQQERWTADELQKYKDGSDPYLYPSVDWADEVLKKNTWQTINNLSVSGGSDIVKYYMNVGFTMQNGLYKTDSNNKFDTNATVERYNFRNNFDVKLSNNLSMSLGLGVIIDNRNYPGYSSHNIFESMRVISPIDYPKQNPDGSLGGAQTYVGWNPYGRATQSGYQTMDGVTLQATLGATWDLSWIVKGLSVRSLFSYDRYANTTNQRPKDFLVKRYLGKDPTTGEDLYSPIFREEQPLDYSQGTVTNRAQYFEGQINYENTFGEHNVSVMALFNQREYINLSAADSRGNIPYRRLGMAGRLTYAYGGRYLLEGDFGYNGSENFAKGHRFGFFPSVSVGWIVSAEPWWNIGFINRLKLRASHGLVGNDVLAIRFGFLNTINTEGQYYYFGDSQAQRFGMEENAIGNNELTWEHSRKTDIGIDLGLFQDRVSLQLDYFTEKRSDILIQRATIPSATGIYPWSIPYGNLGVVKNHGIDALLEVRNTTAYGLFYSLRGNFTFARNEVIENDEPTPAYPYLSGKGRRLGQYSVFIAEGFFRSKEEIDSAPLQTFGSPRVGDVRYKDINGDGRIDSYDQVPTGYARLPEISFGFGGTVAYKGFDMSLFFTGAANTTINLAGMGVWPFYDGLGSNNILREYYDNRWTPETPNAKYPAVDVGVNPNNFVASTIYLRNGNYLRLRNAEIGYTLPKSWLKQWSVGSLRLFINGMNLLTFDHIGFMDPESNDGTGEYPLQRSINFGLQVNFK